MAVDAVPRAEEEEVERPWDRGPMGRIEEPCEDLPDTLEWQPLRVLGRLP